MSYPKKEAKDIIDYLKDVENMYQEAEYKQPIQDLRAKLEKQYIFQTKS